MLTLHIHCYHILHAHNILSHETMEKKTHHKSMTSAFQSCAPLWALEVMIVPHYCALHGLWSGYDTEGGDLGSPPKLHVKVPPPPLPQEPGHV